MFRKLLCMVLVLGLASTAYAVPYAYCGFNSTPLEPGEIAPNYQLGNLVGQGSAVNGWAGPWVGSSVFQVLEGGCSHNPAPPCHQSDPDQHGLAGSLAEEGTKAIQRDLDPFTGDWRLEFCVNLLGEPHYRWQNQFQVLLRDSNGKRALHVKYEPGANEFRMNERDMLYVMNGLLPGNIDIGLKGHAAFDWIHWRIDYTEATMTYDLYWEHRDTGAMTYVGSHIGHKDAAFNGTVAQFKLEGPKLISGYTPAEAGAAFDRVLITPEPASLLLLAGAGLGLLRRRRA